MKPQLNAGYWNNRYLSGEFGWDLGEVSPPLKSYFDQLNDQHQKILIPGAGNAYEAEYLINKGFTQVYVCDYAEEALKNLHKRCPDFPANHLIREDFFKLEGLTFDLIIEQTFFCAIDPSLRKSYFEKMELLLHPGGKLVGLLFDDDLNSDKPPFGGHAADYRPLFENKLITRTFELCYNSVKPRAGRELFMILQKKEA